MKAATMMRDLLRQGIKAGFENEGLSASDIERVFREELDDVQTRRNDETARQLFGPKEEA